MLSITKSKYIKMIRATKSKKGVKGRKSAALSLVKPGSPLTQKYKMELWG